MALEIKDGVSSSADITIDADGVGVGAAVSLKCGSRLISTTHQEDNFVIDTFCSGTAEVSRRGKTRVLFNILGFVTSGSIYSAPGSLRALAAATILLLQFDTGCTVAGEPRVEVDQNTQEANGPTSRVISGRFSGTVATTWVLS